MTAQTYYLNGKDGEQIRRNAISFLNRLDLTKPWKVTVEAFKKPKTQKQLNALWGVAYPAIAKHYGYSGRAEMEHLHSCFCGDFWGWVDVPLGKPKPRRTTTTNERGEKEDCSAEEMAGLYDHIQRNAASDGCDVPDPDPTWFMQARFNHD